MISSTEDALAAILMETRKIFVSDISINRSNGMPMDINVERDHDRKGYTLSMRDFPQTTIIDIVPEKVLVE